MIRPENSLLNGIDAVTCDLWYTLVYLRRGEQRKLAQARLRAWVEASSASGATQPEVRRWERTFDRWGRLEEHEGRAMSVERRAMDIARRWGTPIDLDRLTQGLDRALLGVQVSLATGLPATLRRMRADGIRLGIVSNVVHETSRGLRRFLAREGLDRFFQTRIFSSEVRRAKPDPLPFRLALKSLNASPRRAAHIGDLRVDVIGARVAGVRPILYTGLRRYLPVELKAPSDQWLPRVPRLTDWRQLN